MKSPDSPRRLRLKTASHSRKAARRWRLCRGSRKTATFPDSVARTCVQVPAGGTSVGRPAGVEAGGACGLEWPPRSCTRGPDGGGGSRSHCPHGCGKSRRRSGDPINLTSGQFRAGPPVPSPTPTPLPTSQGPHRSWLDVTAPKVLRRVVQARCSHHIRKFREDPHFSEAIKIRVGRGRVSSRYAKVSGSTPGQSPHEKQPRRHP